MRKKFTIWKGVASNKGLRLLKEKISTLEFWKFEEDESFLVIYSDEEVIINDLKVIIEKFKLSSYMILDHEDN